VGTTYEALSLAAVVVAKDETDGGRTKSAAVVARKLGWRAAQNTVNTTRRGRRSGQTAATMIVAADAIKSKKKKKKEK